MARVLLQDRVQASFYTLSASGESIENNIRALQAHGVSISDTAHRIIASSTCSTEGGDFVGLRSKVGRDGNGRGMRHEYVAREMYLYARTQGYARMAVIEGLLLIRHFIVNDCLHPRIFLGHTPVLVSEIGLCCLHLRQRTSSGALIDVLPASPTMTHNDRTLFLWRTH